jgi:hypothetical protein
MVNLKIPPQKAILLITERIDDLKTIKAHPDGLEYYGFIGWCSKTWAAIDQIYGSDDPHSEELRMIGLSNCSCNAHGQAQILSEVFHFRLLDYIGEIRAGMTTNE